jgi:hypothetical protein
MDSLPKVVGYIMLPDAPKKHKCTCDDCGDVLDDSFGDPRVEVKTFDSRDAKRPSAIRMLCECCVYDLFYDSEPHSIFG